MKVLHVIPYMHPNAGGPPVVVEQIVRNLRDMGHQSCVLTTPLFCRGDEKQLEQAWKDLAPLEFLPSGRLAALMDPSASRKVSAYVAGSDIVHVHTLWHSLNYLVRRACKSLSRPYVIMPHGMLDPYSLSVDRFKKRIFLSLFEHSNLQGAERVVYATAEERRLAENGVPQLKQGYVAPLGGDAPGDADGSLKHEFLTAYPAIRNKRLLLFLGRVDFKKGIDRIIAALPSVLSEEPNAALLIVGDEQASYAEQIRAAIASRGLQDAVVWTGRLAGRAKWGAYSASEIFLLPSRQENFAITVAEAMHMGTPVIISDKVNTASYVLEADAGIVLGEAKCETELAQAILSLLSDRRRTERMSERGRGYAGKHLTWAKTAERMLALYESILEARST